MLILLGIYILVCGGGKLKALPKLLGDHTDLGHLVIIRRLLVGIGRQHGDQQLDVPMAGRRAIDQMNIAGTVKLQHTARPGMLTIGQMNVSYLLRLDQRIGMGMVVPDISAEGVR